VNASPSSDEKEPEARVNSTVRGANPVRKTGHPYRHRSCPPRTAAGSEMELVLRQGHSTEPPGLDHGPVSTGDVAR
jgi:hypothetical protein